MRVFKLCMSTSSLSPEKITSATWLPYFTVGLVGNWKCRSEQAFTWRSLWVSESFLHWKRQRKSWLRVCFPKGIIGKDVKKKYHHVFLSLQSPPFSHKHQQTQTLDWFAVSVCVCWKCLLKILSPVLFSDHSELGWMLMVFGFRPKYL